MGELLQRKREKMEERQAKKMDKNTTMAWFLMTFRKRRWGEGEGWEQQK